MKTSRDRAISILSKLVFMDPDSIVYWSDERRRYWFLEMFTEAFNDCSKDTYKTQLELPYTMGFIRSKHR